MALPLMVAGLGLACGADLFAQELGGPLVSKEATDGKWDVPDVTLEDGGKGPEPALLEMEPTPLTSLIDFSQYRNPAARGVLGRGLPIWLESVQVDEATLPGQTTFRLRLRAMPGLNDHLLLRLFFVDRANARPVVSAWNETGECRFISHELGAGLGLPASESLQLSTQGVDYLEITVPGDGSTLRQALVSTLRPVKVQAALDFAPSQEILDPFGASVSSRLHHPGALAPGRDTFLYGRVRAMLEPGTVKLTPGDASAIGGGPGEPEKEGRTVHFAFDLVAPPLMVMVTFETLNPEPAAPLLVWANGKPAGAIAMQLPDLADPGYQGAVKGLHGMSFHYAGWVTSQKIIPGHLLRSGENVVTLQLPSGAGAVAIRRVELQLKNHWHQLDYTVTP